MHDTPLKENRNKRMAFWLIIDLFLSYGTDSMDPRVFILCSTAGIVCIVC